MTQPQPVLSVFENGVFEENLFLTGEENEILTAGRHPDCSIHLLHPSISRIHFQVELNRSLQKFSVIDLSANGTWVSGKKIEPHVPVEMYEGDTIRVASSTRAYRLHWVPYALSYDLDKYNPFLPPLGIPEVDMEIVQPEIEVETLQHADDHSIEWLLNQCYDCFGEELAEIPSIKENCSIEWWVNQCYDYDCFEEELAGRAAGSFAQENNSVEGKCWVGTPTDVSMSDLNILNNPTFQDETQVEPNQGASLFPCELEIPEVDMEIVENLDLTVKPSSPEPSSPLKSLLDWASLPRQRDAYELLDFMKNMTFDDENAWPQPISAAASLSEHENSINWSSLRIIWSKGDNPASILQIQAVKSRGEIIGHDNDTECKSISKNLFSGLEECDEENFSPSKENISPNARLMKSFKGKGKLDEVKHSRSCITSSSMCLETVEHKNGVENLDLTVNQCYNYDCFGEQLAGQAATSFAQENNSVEGKCWVGTPTDVSMSDLNILNNPTFQDETQVEPNQGASLFPCELEIPEVDMEIVENLDLTVKPSSPEPSSPLKSLLDWASLPRERDAYELLDFMKNMTFDDENAWPQPISAAASLSEHENSINWSSLRIIWSKGDNPASILQIQAVKSRGEIIGHDNDTEYKSISKNLFSGLEECDEENFSPSKENISPNARLMKSFKGKGKLDEVKHSRSCITSSSMCLETVEHKNGVENLDLTVNQCYNYDCFGKQLAGQAATSFAQENNSVEGKCWVGTPTDVSMSDLNILNNPTFQDETQVEPNQGASLFPCELEIPEVDMEIVENLDLTVKPSSPEPSSPLKSLLDWASLPRERDAYELLDFMKNMTFDDENAWPQPISAAASLSEHENSINWSSLRIIWSKGDNPASILQIQAVKSRGEIIGHDNDTEYKSISKNLFSGLEECDEENFSPSKENISPNARLMKSFKGKGKLDEVKHSRSCITSSSKCLETVEHKNGVENLDLMVNPSSPGPSSALKALLEWASPPGERDINELLGRNPMAQAWSSCQTPLFIRVRGHSLQLFSERELLEKDNGSIDHSMDFTMNLSFDDENACPRSISSAAGLSEQEKSVKSPTPHNIWSRRDKPASILQIQTDRSKGEIIGEHNNTGVDLQTQEYIGYKSISKTLFCGLEERDSENFTPNKENISPNSRLVNSFKGKGELEEVKHSRSCGLEERDSENFTPNKENISPNARLVNSFKGKGELEEVKHSRSCRTPSDVTFGHSIQLEEDSIVLSNRENRTRKVFQEKKLIRITSSKKGKMGKKMTLKKGVETVLFQSLSENTADKSRSEASVPDTTTRSSNPVNFTQTTEKRVNNSSFVQEGRRSWTMVVDTTTLLDKESRKSLQLLQGLKGTQLIIPKTVMRELHCLKGRGGLFRRTSEVLFRRKNEVSSALDWIGECLLKTKWWIHVEEEERSTAPIPADASPRSQFIEGNVGFHTSLTEIVTPSAEDNILDYALLFRKMKKDGQLVLLSNAVTLKIKAMAEGLICETAQEFRENLVNPFSERFMWAGSSARGHTWSYLKDVVLPEKYSVCCPVKRGECSAKGLKLLLPHSSARGHTWSYLKDVVSPKKYSVCCPVKRGECSAKGLKLLLPHSSARGLTWSYLKDVVLPEKYSVCCPVKRGECSAKGLKLLLPHNSLCKQFR